MDPMLIILAIRAAIRLGRAGEDALAQYARDRAVLLPRVEKLPESDKNDIITYLTRKYAPLPSGLPAEMKAYYQVFLTGGATDAEYDNAIRYFLAVKADLPDTETVLREAPHYWMIEQWRKGDAPPGPAEKLLIAIFDVSVEVAAYKPGLFGISGAAEPLVKSFAESLHQDISSGALKPDDLRLETLTGLFLKGALTALEQHPDALISNEQYQLLAKNVVGVLSTKLPLDNLENLKKRYVLDDLLPAIAGSVVKTVAQDPAAFLGRRFDTNDPLGAITQAYLIKVANAGIDTLNGKSGAKMLYESIIGLLAKRPDLFLGEPDTETEKFLNAIVEDVATKLQTLEPTFGKDMLVRLACATLDSAGENAGLVLQPGKPWQNVLAQTLKPVLSAISDSINGDTTAPLNKLIKGNALLEFVRPLVIQISKTPGMLDVTDSNSINALIASLANAMAADDKFLLTEQGWITLATVAAEHSGHALIPLLFAVVKEQLLKPDGSLSNTLASSDFIAALLATFIKELARRPGMLVSAGHEESRRVLAAIAGAMAKDKNLLLTREDWLTIAATAAGELAVNPGRLVSADNQAVFEPIIGSLLTVAAKQWIATGRPAVAVVFGATLRDAILVVLRTVSGNVASVLRNRDAIQKLADDLTMVVANNPEIFGSKEWLRLYRILLPELVAKGSLDAITVDMLNTKLRQREAIS